LTRKIVLLDLDGTLIDSGASVARCWKRLAEAAGVGTEVLGELQGMPSRATIARLLGEERADEVEAWAKRHLQLECEDVGDIVAYADAGPLLEWLDGRADAAWGIVTSCGRSLAHARLAAAGLPVPETLVTADDVERGKPDPAPYLKGAAALARAGDALYVVEDAPAGVIAGLRAGATVLAVTTTHEASRLTQAHTIVRSLAGVREYLSAVRRAH